MPDRDPSTLLDQAQRARVEESRARRLADHQTDAETRAMLLRYADDQRTKAESLEQQAGNARSVVQKHTISEQMQQAKLTPANDKDPE